MGWMLLPRWAARLQPPNPPFKQVVQQRMLQCLRLLDRGPRELGLRVDSVEDAGDGSLFGVDLGYGTPRRPDIPFAHLIKSCPGAQALDDRRQEIKEVV